jgi:hypothetical protein
MASIGSGDSLVVAAIPDWSYRHLDTHEPNVDNLEIIVNLHDEPVFVATNIENHPVPFQLACSPPFPNF